MDMPTTPTPSQPAQQQPTTPVAPQSPVAPAPQPASVATAGKRPVWPLVLMILSMLFLELFLSIVLKASGDLATLRTQVSSNIGLNLNQASNFYMMEIVVLSILNIMFLVDVVLYIMRKKLFTTLVIITYVLCVLFFIADPLMEKPVLNAIYDLALKNNVVGVPQPVFNTGKLIIGVIYAAVGSITAAILLRSAKAKAAFVR